MRKISMILFLSAILSTPQCVLAQHYSNDKYSVQVSKSGDISLTTRSADKKTVVFKPEFRFSYLDKEAPHSMERIVRNEDSGVDNVIFRTFTWGKEQDVFKIGNPRPFILDRVSFGEGKVEFDFKDNEYGRLKASLIVPEGNEDPFIQYDYDILKTGCHSVSFFGAPEADIEECTEFWQPMVWTQKRFPGKSYLTPSYLCALPMTAVEAGNRSYAVVADPESFPFQPLPTFSTSGFGVSLRNPAGKAQPVLWAPIIGTSQSQFNAGDTFRFKIRLVVNPGSMLDLHEDIALNLYGLKQYHRDNQIGVNMNTTLDNMLDFGMSQYSWFISELKGCSYESDVKTAVKNVSSLNFLNMALVTDNERIYRERFLPVCEFMLSREDMLFALNPEYRGPGRQNAKNRLGKTCATFADIASLYECTGKQSHFLMDTVINQGRGVSAERYPNGVKSSNVFSWRNPFAMYRVTENRHFLDETCRFADQYIEEDCNQLLEVFNSPNDIFTGTWPGNAPRFPELYRLWLETDDPKYLEAAHYGARRYAQFIIMCPAIPEGKTVVNKGGYAPRQKPYGDLMRVPEEEVDCWRLSEIGLTAESASTSSSHRVVFWANYAPYMLKIAHETGDEFLAKIANWALVGRYSSFPGYHINTERTTVYEKPDFPLHTFHELNVNSIHYNHIWPAMTILLDYLVSDAMVRSDYKIDFPPIPLESYINFTSELYGHKSGKFYGEKADLWMPQRLIETSDPQLNYIAARSESNKLFLAFMNQSFDKVQSTIRLNPEWVKTNADTKIRFYGKTGKLEKSKVRNGGFDIEVKGNGFLAVCIENVDLSVGFQQSLLSSSEQWTKDYCRNEYGQCMLFDFCGLPPHVYNFIEGTPGSYKRVGMSYRIDGQKWVDLLDCVFPFEFSIDLPKDAHKFEYKYVIVDKDNKTIRTSVEVLEK